MVAVVVAVLHPIELISFNFDFDELFHPSPVGHWFARFRFCHSYWWFWLWFWFCFLFSFSSIYLCWMFFFVLLRFVLFCRRILFYCRYLLLCLSVRPFGCLTAIVIVVFYLPPLCVYDGLSSYLNHNKNTSYRISVCDNFRDYLSTNIRWMRIVLLSTMLFLKRNGKRKLMRDRERGRERGKCRLTTRITTNTLFML